MNLCSIVSQIVSLRNNKYNEKEK